jgi:LuxR family maltose regulon positive regulatory protein
MGQVSAAVAWQAQQNFSPADGQALQVQWGLYTTFVRVELALGHFDSVINWLDTLTHLLDETHQPLRAAEIYLLQALTHQAQGQPEAALQALRHALAVAEGQNYVGLFLDEGPGLRPLLSLLAAQVTGFTFAQHVLDMLAQQAPPAEPPLPPPALLIEALTERELEVLALMAQGYTHQAIAEALIVAVGTVKKHAHNIYGKLGVSNRTQAILKAKALQLVA